MPAFHRFGTLIGLCFVLVTTSDIPLRGDGLAPSFDRQVRPILAKHCFTCHGPDPEARQADLRLDQAETALQDLGGYQAIVPGDPGASEIIARITSDDDDLRMPPSDSHPPLSQAEVETLSAWIAAGAKYQRHWAFVPPQPVRVPAVSDPSWCRTPIDRFVLRRIEDAGLAPAPAANREAIARRLFLDLAGVNPSQSEVDRFVRDDHPAAYQRLVDRLLASPEYAERFARPWLDLARYSDTNGYEKDRPRTIWPFRDWVIQALATDMPFDQFSIEQLAGDMLPGATASQRIATGFHRNTMLNEEGGIDPLEYRFYAMVDRVATTGTVWMGLTTGCAQCHTHKYDPISHHDYYAMFALMNNADEPDILVPNEIAAAQRDQIQAEIATEQQRLADEFLPAFDRVYQDGAATSALHHAFKQWLERQLSQVRDWQTLRPVQLHSTMPKLRVLDDDSILASGDVTKRDVYRLTFDIAASTTATQALRLEVLPHQSLPAGGPGMAFYEGRRGDFFLSELRVSFNGEPVKLQDASHSYGKISVGSGSADAANVIDGEGSTGWSTSGREGQANRLVVNFAKPLEGSGELQVELLFERHFAAALGRFRIALTSGDRSAAAMSLPPQADEALADAISENGQIRHEKVYQQLQRHYVRTADDFSEHRKHIERLEQQLPETIRTLGLRQRDVADYRVTRRHHRGEYLKAEEVVEPAVPAVFPALNEDVPADRLALAQWLLSDNNPLVGRVTANRAWREFFGSGIVRTAGDFGTQSEPPSHPELLDWLDQRLRRNGWSIKRLHRLIVLSASYRQSLGHPPAADPGNRLLSCFPYRRLDAERIRDVMLSASDLLVRKLGGPSVYPPQPESVMQMAYGSPSWNESKGADRYRRSLYTFAKRTAPFAAYTTFDAPTGELCIARRDRSTTPLQALTLMNDAMYMEIAKGLAEAALRDAGPDAGPEEIVATMFRRLLVRTPEEVEVKALLRFYRQQSEHPEPWTLVARALMNTDEAITTP